MNRRSSSPLGVAAIFSLFLGPIACAPPGAEKTPMSPAVSPEKAVDKGVRVAVFNVRELSREKLDRVDAEGRGADPQLRAAAEIVQRVRPAVLLLNEIDFDAGERANARLFRDRYLRVPQGGREPIDYPHVVFLAVNTGQPSGLDLNRDGDPDDPEDAWGFGRYPGQYGMALYSRLPVDEEVVRTFQHLPWRAVPGHLMPDGEGGRPEWYGAEAAARLRLSSKSHWDVPVTIDGTTVHFLASHPTPPIFDGDEDRNGRRNFDEIRLWADYVSGGEKASWIVDDRGRRGGLEPGAPFVILGDLNADPHNDPGVYGKTAIAQLLEHPRVQDPRPASAGALHVERDYGGDKAHLTAEFGRADYVLPSAGLEVRDAGVFWPPPGDPLRPLVEGESAASDHRLVWVDLAVP